MTGTLTPQAATRILQEANGWDQSLAQRTEGITWMIWGMTTSALLMTLGFTTLSDLPPWAVVTAWTPWVLIGSLLTYVVWRTAALSRPQRLEPPGWMSYATKMLALVALVLLLHFVVRPQTLAAPMALIGVGWAGVGLLSNRLSRRGRRVSVLIGGLVFVAAVLLEWRAPGMTTTMLIGTAVLGLAPIALGAYQALRE